MFLSTYVQIKIAQIIIQCQISKSNEHKLRNAWGETRALCEYVHQESL